ncbi:MAG TPA: acyl-CoA dehydrogenase family protein [Caulobacteraceae bacterium]
MNFDFDTDQLSLRAEFRRFFEKACDLRVVRRIAEGDDAVTAGLADDLRSLGMAGLAVPAAAGGLGLGPLELCIAAEEAGRALVPGPLIASAGPATLALCRYAGPDVQAAWLPRLAGGDASAAVVLRPLHDSALVERGLLTLTKHRLNGFCSPAADMAAADLLIVECVNEISGEPALVCIERNAPGVTVRSLKSADPTRTTSELVCSDVQAQLLCAGPAARQAAEWLRRAWAVFIAFEQLGMAESALAMAVRYAQERRTFGRVIGSYQAIKHKLTDVFVSIQLARAHAYFAAWALVAAEDRLPLAAAAARVACTEASMLAAQENIQTHGGIGYTWEADCHFFYKRARYYAAVIGSSAYWRSELAVHLRGASRAEPAPPTLDSQGAPDGLQRYA